MWGLHVTPDNDSLDLPTIGRSSAKGHRQLFANANRLGVAVWVGRQWEIAFWERRSGEHDTATKPAEILCFRLREAEERTPR